MSVDDISSLFDLPAPAVAGAAFSLEDASDPSIEEVVALAAVDNQFYGQAFFPRTLRQKTPLFHRDIDDLLEDSSHRYVAIEVFRGGAKTTKLRIYTSKRIAYGISRTILFVSATQDHSKKSLAWLKRNIEFNKKWAQTYGLRRGKKWTEEHIEIIHDSLSDDEEEFVITILAVGITGQVRGVNIDDWRPDLIVVDDPCDEENTATPEQRKKTDDLFFGALQNSLAPTSETPEAKLVLLQTSLNKEDLINSCHKDSRFASRKYSCFDDRGESRWPSRWTTEELLAEKQGFIDRNQLLLWLREMECKTGDAETADFRSEWLRFWELLPEGMVFYLGVDPVPPPTPKQLEQGLQNKDFETLYVVGVYRGDFYLVDYRRNRGHEPDWTIAAFFELVDKWRPIKARVETVAYQRTLKWLLEKAMKKRKRYLQIEGNDDKRKKRHRILQAFQGLASQGRFYVRRDMQDFIEQFTSYPNVSHDDDLDGASQAVECANDVGLGTIEGDDYATSVLEEDYDALPTEWMSAP